MQLWIQAVIILRCGFMHFQSGKSSKVYAREGFITMPLLVVIVVPYIHFDAFVVSHIVELYACWHHYVNRLNSWLAVWTSSGIFLTVWFCWEDFLHSMARKMHISASAFHGSHLKSILLRILLRQSSQMSQTMSSSCKQLPLSQDHAHRQKQNRALLSSRAVSLTIRMTKTCWWPQASTHKLKDDKGRFPCRILHWMWAPVLAFVARIPKRI